MIEISAVRDLVAIFGVLAGFAYYIVTVQNANKVRKTQLLMEIYDEEEKKRPSKQHWKYIIGNGVTLTTFGINMVTRRTLKSVLH